MGFVPLICCCFDRGTTLVTTPGIGLLIYNFDVCFATCYNTRFGVCFSVFVFDFITFVFVSPRVITHVICLLEPWCLFDPWYTRFDNIFITLMLVSIASFYTRNRYEFWLCKLFLHLTTCYLYGLQTVASCGLYIHFFIHCWHFVVECCHFVAEAIDFASRNH